MSEQHLNEFIAPMSACRKDLTSYLAEMCISLRDEGLLLRGRYPLRSHAPEPTHPVLCIPDGHMSNYVAILRRGTGAEIGHIAQELLRCST
jgi:hypothetical protein